MNENIREMLAGYVDGELTDDERLEFERALTNDSELRAELEEMMKLMNITGNLKYADLPDEVWDNYWASLYKKLERGIGWIFFSVGAIFLVCYGLFNLLSGIFYNPEISLLVKIAVAVLTIGTVTILVSLIRERFFASKHERYTEVMK